jgi:predicted nucleotidyltransferase
MNILVPTKQDVLNVLRDNHSRIRALGVKRLGLFGSFARGEQRPDSDVDLLVEFEPGWKTFDSFMELSFLLEELLQRRVELVTTEALSPYIGPHILGEVEYATLTDGEAGLRAQHRDHRGGKKESAG